MTNIEESITHSQCGEIIKWFKTTMISMISANNHITHEQLKIYFIKLKI